MWLALHTNLHHYEQITGVICLLSFQDYYQFDGRTLSFIKCVIQKENMGRLFTSWGGGILAKYLIH